MISLFCVFSIASVALGAARYGKGEVVDAMGPLVGGGVFAALTLAMINE